MSAKTKYTDGPIGPLKVVPDFLPSPEELAFKEDTVKITIALSKESVEFFKQEAKRHHVQYQKMIRRLLDAYTQAPKHTSKTGPGLHPGRGSHMACNTTHLEQHHRGARPSSLTTLPYMLSSMDFFLAL